MKAKSKYILFVFVGIIVMLLAGIFVSIPQAKTELIYADAASDCSTLGHDWEDEWSSDATMHWHACSRCGAKKEISLGLPEDRLKHTPGPAATCTEDQVCTVCGRVLKEALGHEWGDEWSSDSSMHWHGCSRCDAKYESTIGIPDDKLKHTAGSAATCTTPQTCTVCGFVIKKALGHSEGAPVRENEVPASCAKAGSYDEVVYCSACGDELSREKKTIDSLGHSFTKYVSDGNATCTADGTETAKCDRCDVTDTRTDVGSAAHDWSEMWTTDGTSHWHECSRCDAIKDKANHSGGTATCIKKAACSVCGKEYGSYGSHSYTRSDVESTQSYCPDTKYTCRYCSSYYYSSTGTTSRTLHSLTSRIETEATCTTTGRRRYTCTDCNYTYTALISALGHDWSDKWTTDGTSHWHECTQCNSIKDKATHSGGTATCIALAKCSVCGKSYGSYGSHSYTRSTVTSTSAYCSDTKYTCRYCSSYYYLSTGTTSRSRHSLTSRVETAATCTTAGTRRYTCTDCSYTYTTSISALDHDWSDKWTTDGSSHWHECSRCDEINDKANHSGGTATCIKKAVCSVCRVEYGDFADHVYVESAEEQYLVSAATCTAKAVYYKSCSVCGEAGKETFEYGDPLGHEYGEPAWTWNSYTSATATFTCTRNGCGDKQTVTASGSSITSVVTTPAECEKEGLKTYTAKVTFGGEEYTDTTTEKLEALGHTEGEAVRENEVPASCIVAGSYDEVVYCSVCGDELSREEKVIDALGHDLKHHEAKPATCTEIGWNAYDTCLRCDYTTYRELAAKGHTPGTSATCTEAQICTVCGTTLTAALGHEFKNGYCVRCGVPEDIAFENAKEDTKSDLDEISQEIKDKIDSSDLPDEVKEGLKVIIDKIISDAKNDVNGALDYDDLNDIIHDAEQKIEDAVQNAEQDDAKTELDEIAQNAKDEIDASDLPDDVKEDLKDKIDEIIGGAKDEVNGELTKEELDRVIEDTKNEIEDAVQNAEKDDAKSELDEIAQNAKEEIDASDLPDDVKEDLKDKIDEIIGGAKDEVNGELTKEELDQVIEDTKNEIEDAVQNAEKDDAKTELDEIAQNAKDEVDASDLPDDVKEDLKDKIDEIIGGAKDEVDGSIDFDDVDQSVEDARQEIEDMILNAEKDEAKSDLDEIVQNAKDEIDSSELSDEGKTELKGKLDEILTSKKEEIGIAMTPEEIEEVLNSARDEIAALTGNLTEVQPDAIPLWPWLIAAGVISAALSAIFAWRHVKSVRAKGRTIGAKSIVTIAVATILIFVVVIGITFLIFAMI